MAQGARVLAEQARRPEFQSLAGNSKAKCGCSLEPGTPTQCVWGGGEIGREKDPGPC